MLRLKPKDAVDEKAANGKPVQYDEIKMYEKAGKMRLKVKEGKYFCDFEVVVPEFYPS